jgi:hypothetical protein
MRVLFVGNSHTYMNGLPYQVRELVNAAAGREECQAWMNAVGGMSLAGHAEEVGTQLNLTCNPWDFVVLQQQTHPFAGYAQFAADYEQLRPHLERSDAEVLLYVTWKRRDAPESDQEELDAAFARLARQRALRVVPVGAAWRRAREVSPEIELYAADGAHASPAGTYLAACVFFGALTGKSPLGLPARISANGTVLAGLPAEHAQALQRIAAEMRQGE